MLPREFFLKSDALRLYLRKILVEILHAIENLFSVLFLIACGTLSALNWNAELGTLQHG